MLMCTQRSPTYNGCLISQRVPLCMHITLLTHSECRSAAYSCAAWMGAVSFTHTLAIQEAKTLKAIIYILNRLKVKAEVQIMFFIDIVRNILFLLTKALNGSESLSIVDMYTVLQTFQADLWRTSDHKCRFIKWRPLRSNYSWTPIPTGCKCIYIFF